MIIMLEERDKGISLYGLCSLGGPEERWDAAKRIGIGERDGKYIEVERGRRGT